MSLRKIAGWVFLTIPFIIMVLLNLFLYGFYLTFIAFTIVALFGVSVICCICLGLHLLEV
jgi:hypothetical protein